MGFFRKKKTTKTDFRFWKHKGPPFGFEKIFLKIFENFFFEKNPMTNKIKKFLYTLEHLIPDGYDEIPTFALYHPLLSKFAVKRRILFLIL